MAYLHQQRCFNHAEREAAARCPECGRYYCRECVTEHENRLVCSSCLTREIAGAGEAGKRVQMAIHAAGGAAAFLALWFGFYLVGAGLLQIPTALHDSVLQGWTEEAAEEDSS